MEQKKKGTNKKTLSSSVRGRGHNPQYNATQKNKERRARRRAHKFERLAKKRELKTGSWLPVTIQKRQVKRHGKTAKTV